VTDGYPGASSMRILAPTRTRHDWRTVRSNWSSSKVSAATVGENNDRALIFISKGRPVKSMW
jgi:hypothetical protein